MSSPIKLKVMETRIIRGVSPVVAVNRIDGGVQISITDIDGLKIATLKDGRLIESIQKTGSNGQEDTYAIRLSDGEVFEFKLVNEANGEAYAVGSRGNVAVEEGDPAWHNNAKYYLEMIRQLIAYYPAMCSMNTEGVLLTDRTRVWTSDDGIEHNAPVYEIPVTWPANGKAEEGSLLAIKMGADFVAPAPRAYYELTVTDGDTVRHELIGGMRSDYDEGTILFKADTTYLLICHVKDGTVSYDILDYAPEVPGLIEKVHELTGDAEAWANGTRNGVDISSDDPAYQKNGRYYAEIMDGVAEEKADKTDTVLETTLSRGRKEDTTVGEGSFAFGRNVEASGLYSQAEGELTIASGRASHAEGRSIGYAEYIDGERVSATYYTTASGAASHAEGQGTHAEKSGSHAEGTLTKARGATSHAEGTQTDASGNYSHAEGGFATASGTASHAEGEYTIASGFAAHAEGNSVEATGAASHAEGEETIARGDMSHAEGIGTIANGQRTHVQGAYNVEDTLWPEYTEGITYEPGTRITYQGKGYECVYRTTHDPLASGGSVSWKKLPGSSNAALIVGNGIGPAERVRSNAFTLDWDGNGIFAGDVYANGDKKLISEDTIGGYLSDKADKANPVFTGSISLGRNTDSAVGENSVAIGQNVEATGKVSYAEGGQTRAIGYYSHAEGSNSAAYGQGSHVEGVSTIAQGTWAHAEGSYTSAFGAEAHAEGNYTSARGEASHAEGYYAQAKGKYSHAEGYNTSANADLMHAQGLYNANAVLFPAWSVKTYAVGDMVTYGDNKYGYVCTVANSDSRFDYSKWVQLPYNSPTAFVIGNGNATVGSNAFEVQWDGTAKAQTALQIGNTKITEAQLQQLLALLN